MKVLILCNDFSPLNAIITQCSYSWFHQLKELLDVSVTVNEFDTAFYTMERQTKTLSEILWANLNLPAKNFTVLLLRTLCAA